MDTTATPKVLDRCLALFEKPSVPTETQSKPSTPARYASHPDIQFFSSVKTRHHFAYHQSKTKQAKTLRLVRKNALVFNPYSRPQLLRRIHTYSSLSWALPYTSEDTLTELACARAGWIHTGKQNELRCVSCQQQAVLRFNEVGTQPKYTVVPLDFREICAMNQNLKLLYLEKLRLLLHARNCPWRNFQCPERVYYLAPHLVTTDEILVKQYGDALKTALDDYQVIKLFETELWRAVELFVIPDIVPVSKEWLLATYYADSKENSEPMLDEKLSRPVYTICALGWVLKVERFLVKTVLVLHCLSCTEKHFLGPDSVVPSHKQWCLHSSNMGAVSFLDYFCNMLVALGHSIGPGGEYQSDFEVSLDALKLLGAIDVNEGLSKLSELRKLYFADA